MPAESGSTDPRSFGCPCCAATIKVRERIASPEPFLTIALLPHLICSPPVGGGGDFDEAGQHGGARWVGGGDRKRYGGSLRWEKARILDEFVAVTGYHRKHAMRLLRDGRPGKRSGPRPTRRVYDEAVREALVVLWEASDRVCGKRLKPLLPVLIEGMERHGHLQLSAEIRAALLTMSAATIDRALRQVREQRRTAAPPCRFLGSAAQCSGSYVQRLA